MPNGRNHRRYEDYGPHSYEEGGTSDCKFHCGCWMGPARSGGPTGIDPFGSCPGNHISGEKGIDDYDDVVTGRMNFLEHRVYELEKYEKLVLDSKKQSKVSLMKSHEELKELRNSIALSTKDFTEKLEKLSQEIRTNILKLI